MDNCKRYLVECESPEEKERLEFARDYLRSNPKAYGLPVKEQAAIISRAYQDKRGEL